jgi:hypothetical protein
MSTKTSLKRHWDRERRQGYHLYVDIFDDPDNPVVHLELNGVEFEASTTARSGTVTVIIPAKWATELGLLPRPEAT